MQKNRITITLNTIRQLKPGSRDRFIWDADARGLGVKVTPKGAKRWVFQYFLNGRDRRITLGDATSISPYDDREEARQLYAGVRLKSCPATKRSAARSALTMAKLLDRFMDEHSRIENKPSTIRANEGLISTHLKPTFSRFKIDEVTPDHIKALRTSLDTRHITFNRCLALLRTVFNFAKTNKLRIDNPCDGIKGYEETPPTRTFSDRELGLIGKGLNTMQAARTGEGRLTSAVDALRLAACQGFRISEPRTCTWAEIDWDQRLLKLADSKTGAKDVPLGPVTLMILKDIKARQEHAGVTSEYICPSPADPKRPISYTSVKEAFDTITKQHNIQKSTPHTFRRTSATTIAARTNDVFGLRDAFGWKSLAMPNYYVGLAQENAKRVVRLQEDYLPAELFPPLPSDDEAAVCADER